MNTKAIESGALTDHWPPAPGDTICSRVGPALVLRRSFPGRRQLHLTPYPPCPACITWMTYSAADVEWRCPKCGTAPSRQGMREVAIAAGASRIWNMTNGPGWYKLAYAAYLRWRWLRRPA